MFGKNAICRFIFKSIKDKQFECNFLDKSIILLFIYKDKNQNIELNIKLDVLEIETNEMITVQGELIKILKDSISSTKNELQTKLKEIATINEKCGFDCFDNINSK